MSGLPSAIRLIVAHGFTHRKPGEERNQEQHADDRHIVGLGHDQAEVCVEQADQRRTRIMTAKRILAALSL